MFTNSKVSARVSTGTKNYWKRSQFLLGGMYAMIFFSALIFLVVLYAGQ